MRNDLVKVYLTPIITNETIVNESMRYGKQKKLTNRLKKLNWDDARQQQHFNLQFTTLRTLRSYICIWTLGYDIVRATAQNNLYDSVKT